MLHPIYPLSVYNHLKMQMASCGFPGAAHIPDHLPCRDGLARGDSGFGHVGVTGCKARAVIYQHLVAITVVLSNI